MHYCYQYQAFDQYTNCSPPGGTGILEGKPRGGPNPGLTIPGIAGGTFCGITGPENDLAESATGSGAVEESFSVTW